MAYFWRYFSVSVDVPSRLHLRLQRMSFILALVDVAAGRKG